MGGKRRCNDCKFFATVDSGYSDYTATETVVHCLLKKNPQLPAEESYSWIWGDEQDTSPLVFAEECEDYTFGSGPHKCVEGAIDLPEWNQQDLLKVLEIYLDGI